MYYYEFVSTFTSIRTIEMLCDIWSKILYLDYFKTYYCRFT